MRAFVKGDEVLVNFLARVESRVRSKLAASDKQNVGAADQHLSLISDHPALA